MNLKPPYVLVGHSYGGMIMGLFASEYPEEVNGLTEREQKLKMFRLGYLLSLIGLPRMLKRHIGANRLPADVQKIVTSLGRRNNAFKAVYSELLIALISPERTFPSLSN